MATIEFATLNDVKDYLEIPQDITQYDNKLNMILEAGNMKCQDYTEKIETDARLKISVCKYVEFNFSRKTGVNSEKDSDFTMEYTAGNAEGKYSDVPAEVLDIWDEYIENEDDSSSMKISLI